MSTPHSLLPGLAAFTLVMMLLPARPAYASTTRVKKAGSSEKKLIEFGWDEPDTDNLAAQVAEMEKMPFDGVVISTHYHDSHGQRKVLEWSAFSSTPITWTSLRPALTNLEAAHFHRFTDNFLRFNSAPGDVDWFDDFSPIVTNARMAARLARKGGLKGLLFDAEAYNAPLFEYPRQKYRDTHSFESYASQVRQRGREVMEAFQKEYPGLVVFMTLGYDVAGSKPSDLRVGRYGLYASFLDGLYEAARGKTIIVDGFESAYSFRRRDQFERAYQTRRSGDLAICGAPNAYERRVSAGFGLWMDYNWRKLGWNVEDPSKNYFTPAGFQAALAAALHRSDRYVWIYTETPRWWGRKNLPQAYVDAVREAREAQ